ncbi:unnamed protein product, partial [Ixodes pacificus]
AFQRGSASSSRESGAQTATASLHGQYQSIGHCDEHNFRSFALLSLGRRVGYPFLTSICKRSFLCGSCLPLESNSKTYPGHPRLILLLVSGRATNASHPSQLSAASASRELCTSLRHSGRPPDTDVV